MFLCSPLVQVLPAREPVPLYLTSLPDLRNVVNDLCSRLGPASPLDVGFLQSILHVLVSRLPVVFYTSTEASPTEFYVFLMPWKPQKFQRFSRLAPTPVSSCLKVQGSRERRASTSAGLICRNTTHNVCTLAHKLRQTFSHVHYSHLCSYA